VKFQVFTSLKVQAMAFCVLTAGRCRRQGPPKRRYPLTTLHGVRTQKTATRTLEVTRQGSYGPTA